MNTVEDRVRAALRAHAGDFTASADAWERVEARSAPTARRRQAGPSRLTPSRRFLRQMGPAAAAAAVIAVVVAATLTGQALSHHPAGGVTPAASGSDTPSVQGGGDGVDAITDMDKAMFEGTPPTTRVVTMRLGGPTMAAVSFWLGYDDPHAWLEQIITSGLQFCQAEVGMGGGQGGTGHCGPGVPNLGRLPVVPTGPDAGVDSSTDVFYGIAVKRVASVTAVLSDGREYPGQVRSAPGLPEQVWAVSYPGPASGVHVVFRDAAGRDVATIAATTTVPDDLSHFIIQPPATGGIPVFQYPASEDPQQYGGVGGGPSGTLTAYLVDGHVVFWSNAWGALVSPSTIPAGQPALAGVAVQFGRSISSASYKQLKAFGYAHQPVSKVVLRLADGRQFPATVIAAGDAMGWLGTNFRLWWANLPMSVWNQSQHRAPMTVIGYDVRGHVVSTTQLGTGPF